MTIDEYSSIDLTLKDYKSLLRDIRELQTEGCKVSTKISGLSSSNTIHKPYKLLKSKPTMKKMVIWLSNVDSSKSRIEGRKIAKGLAIKEPTLKEMKAAAEHLDLEPEVGEDQYPKDQGKEKGTPGRILVKKKHPKTRTLKLLCDEIRRIRQAHG